RAGHPEGAAQRSPADQVASGGAAGNVTLGSRRSHQRKTAMDFKLELVIVPVSDVDRAKAFYVERAGWNLDVDTTVGGGMRVVQLTPPGSACCVGLGTGITADTPGSSR